MLQRRGHAVDVVRDVALVAEDQVGLVVLQAAPFADGAVQAPPAFLEYHFRHLKTKYVDGCNKTFHANVLFLSKLYNKLGRTLCFFVSLSNEQAYLQKVKFRLK